MKTESVRTAIGELKKESLSLNGRIALSVIEVYINQQERSIMRNFSELSEAEQRQISNRFELPADRSSVTVDEHMVPFTRIHGMLVGCQVINNNFHVHGNRQNGR